MANPQILVEFVGKTTGLTSALKDTEKQTKGLGGRLGKMGRVAVAAGGAAGLGFLISAVKTGGEELADAQKVTAQTEAVLKSTGRAAHVSAKQVDQMASALSAKSGVDDEVIKSGENLLLTFTNIRNESGKGNKIFDQATKVLLDMSVALGQDTKQSAIQLGKALNDPIKGVTALRRVGVSFTEAQTKQIKALVESGKTMDAQKVILKELNKEFGGSAEAAGKTLPGSLSKLQNSYAEIASLLVQTVAPALTKILELFNEHPALLKAVVFGVAALAAAMVVLNVALAVTAVVTSPITIWFVVAAAAIVGLIAVVILLVKNWDTLVDALKKGLEAIETASKDVFKWLKANWPLIAGILAGPFGLAVVEIAKHWDKIGDGARAVKAVVKEVFTDVKSWLEEKLTGLGKVLDDIAALFGKPGEKAKEVVQAIKDAFGGLIEWFGTIIDKMEKAIGKVANAIKAPINAILRAWNSIELKVPEIKIPGVKVFGKKIGGGSFGGWTISFPNVPLLAKGGVLSQPTMVMAGEGRGREIVAPEKLLRQIVQEQVPQVRVFIGDQELRGMVRVEVHRENNRTAQTLLAGLA